MNKRVLIGCASVVVLASTMHVAPVSATAAKPTMSVKVTGCDLPEEEDAEGIDYQYLADELVGTCKVAATIKPRTPKRTMVLQKLDEETETWKDVDKGATNSKGVAALDVPDTFDKECLSYDSFKFRVISRKAGRNGAIAGKAFEVAFLSDPESKACIDSMYGSDDDPSNKSDDDFSIG